MLKRTFSILIISILSLYGLCFAKGKSDTWDDVEIESREVSIKEIEIKKTEEMQVPEKLKVFQEAYPDISFEPEWEDEVKDWKIKMTLGTKEIILYWANGALLPEEELKNKDL